MTQVVDPLNPLRPLREDEIDQRTTPARQLGAGAAPLAYDVYREGHELVIEFDAPGVEPDDIGVAVEGRSIAVTLRRGLNRGPGIDVIEAGRQHGTFRQRLWLGDRWDLDGLRAQARHGVLIVRAPLAPELVSRRISVSAGSGASEADGAHQVRPEPRGEIEVEGAVETAA